MDSLVTVIIPAHNSGPYIVPALDSILAQKHRPIEILVVDDGSTDATVETVLPRYGSSNRSSEGIRRHATLASGPRRESFSLSSIMTIFGVPTSWSFRSLVSSATRRSIWCSGIFRISSLLKCRRKRRERLAVPLQPLPGLLQGAMLARRRSFDRVGLFSEERSIGDFLDRYGRAMLAPMNIEMLPETVVYRRIQQAFSAQVQTPGPGISSRPSERSSRPAPRRPGSVWRSYSWHMNGMASGT